MALVGVVITILMWSTLAASVQLLHGVPTLFLNGVALTLGGLLGLPWAKEWRMPLPLFLAGSLSMFAYHVIYFFALHLGEPIGVSLIHYLWPMLIVLLAPRSSNSRRGVRWHIASAALGMGGAALACVSAIHPSTGLASAQGHSNVTMIGAYALALLSAVAWAGYSLLGTRNTAISSHSVGAFCLSAGLACLALYFATGQMPRVTGPQSAVLLYLGIGPMGAAFYLWDYGMKKGDPRKVAVLSYATPVLSTIALSICLGTRMTFAMWIGTVMVAVSIAISSRSRESQTIRTAGLGAVQPSHLVDADFCTRIRSDSQMERE
jgi:drug/metabolite transporter (DMT)-like permease